VPASPASPATPPPELQQKWNESKTTMFRFFFTLYSFTIMGMNDGAVGVSTFAFPGQPLLLAAMLWLFLRPVGTRIVVLTMC
jgi:hypothetical protein